MWECGRCGSVEGVGCEVCMGEEAGVGNVGHMNISLLYL